MALRIYGVEIDPEEESVRKAELAWREILRSDPCAYCGAMPDELEFPLEADHIFSWTRYSLGSAVGPSPVGWSELTAACRRCNRLKRQSSLLGFLLGCPVGLTLGSQENGVWSRRRRLARWAA